MSKILFSSRKDKIHVFKPPCNFLFYCIDSMLKAVNDFFDIFTCAVMENMSLVIFSVLFFRSNCLKSGGGYCMYCDHFWNFTFWKINWRIIHTVRQPESTKTYDKIVWVPQEKLLVRTTYAKQWCLGQSTKVFLCIFAYFSKLYPAGYTG